MNPTLFPKTTLGKWSIGLVIAAFLCFVVFVIEVAFGFRGGDTFDFRDLWAGIPIMIAGVCFISALMTGVIGIIKYKERSVLVFLSAAAGLFVLLLVLGEFLFPH